MSRDLAHRQRERDAVAHPTNVRTASWLLITDHAFAGHVLIKCKGLADNVVGDAMNGLLAMQTLVLFVIRTMGNPFKSQPSTALR